MLLSPTWGCGGDTRTQLLKAQSPQPSVFWKTQALGGSLGEVGGPKTPAVPLLQSGLEGGWGVWGVCGSVPMSRTEPRIPLYPPTGARGDARGTRGGYPRSGDAEIRARGMLGCSTPEDSRRAPAPGGRMPVSPRAAPVLLPRELPQAAQAGEHRLSYIQRPVEGGAGPRLPLGSHGRCLPPP